MKKAIEKKSGHSVAQPGLSHGEKEEARINKYLTAAGFCSRREADRLVGAGRVKIGGDMAQAGSKVLPGQLVTVDGEPVQPKEAHVYLALHKPIGITCTLETGVEGNLTGFMDFKQRIFPVGRLDKDSSGLLLLTSDGDIVNKILRGEHNHEKEYIVHLKEDIPPGFIQKMASGVEITNMKNKTRVRTKQCQVKQLGKRSFRIILTQGYNRQIRRMCTELGCHVVALRRVRIMHIGLDGLEAGQWRYLTPDEMVGLGNTLGCEIKQ